MREPRPILLVEDDAVDVKTVERAFKQQHLANPLVVATHGREALDLLARPSVDEPQPALILLDLNLPVMNGLEFLAALRADAALRPIPVIVLTTSAEEADLRRAYALGAAGYIVKPVEFSKFVEAVKIIDLYWTLSELPPLG